MRFTGQRRPKYGNTKVKADGFTFDSGAEYQYYLVLKDRQARGQIYNLTVKPKFPLHVNGIPIVVRPFQPDFAYLTTPANLIGFTPTWMGNFEWMLGREQAKLPPRLFDPLDVRRHLVVCDTKGYLDPGDAATRIFEMKLRLVQALYGIEIQIVQTPQAERQQERRRAQKASERSLLRKAMAGEDK